ncbi:MAG: hypothetical protein K2Q33_01170 [Gammaproteobacteria bacterium]|nr:hypothetical protein [Gammaproteobacteria bacterium]
MKEKYTDRNQKTFQENGQKIEAKITQLSTLKDKVSLVLSEDENKRLEHVIENAEKKLTKALKSSNFLQELHNKELVKLAQELNAEIEPLRDKKNPDSLAEELFFYLLDNVEHFENNARLRKEVVEGIQANYTELAQLVGHNLGENDFKRTIKIFHTLKQEEMVNNDQWIKMLGILLYVDTLISPVGNGKWLRGDNCLFKRLINSIVEDLTDEDIINLFRVAFCDDEVKEKFTAFFNKARLKEDIEATLLNGFKTIIFPVRNPLAPRPAHISSERCEGLTKQIHQAVFANEPAVLLEKSKEAEKEEENSASSGARHSVGLSQIEQNRDEVRKLRESVETSNSPVSTRLPFSPYLMPDSPISSSPKRPASCGIVAATPVREEEIDNITSTAFVA